MKTIKIFLASSNTLKKYREQITIQIAAKNKTWHDKGLFFELVIWEDLSAQMPLDRSQSAYNREIAKCDIFILLAAGSLGKYSKEEFETAKQLHDTNAKPKVLVYIDKYEPADESLKSFITELEKMEYFIPYYDGFNDLWNQINKEIDDYAHQIYNRFDINTLNSQLAKQIGATEAYSFLNDARELRTSTESYGVDLTTALVKNYATERYGSESPENIRRTISDFNHYLTGQGSQGVNNMHDIINGFVSGKGYGWGNTTAAVHEAMNATNNRVQGPNGFKHSVGMAAMDAGAKTFSVKEGNLSPPLSDIPMNTPNPKTVTNPADDIRLRNRTEESGNGRIHTTAGKIVKDMAGKNKTDPPRSTHDFYRNQSFYHEGNLVEPQRLEKGIVLPSGIIIRGDAGYTPPENDKDFFKGSVFEKK